MDSFVDVFKGVAQADVFYTTGAAALLGVLFHVSIHKIEFEFIMFHFMGFYILTFFGMIYALVQAGKYSVLGAFARASFCASSFNVGLLTSIGIYRLLFHRCRKFPGPFSAKLTRFYAAKLSAKDVQYYKELAKMHCKYGDFVRTGELL
jgi:hypothetical protein